MSAAEPVERGRAKPLPPARSLPAQPHAAHKVRIRFRKSGPLRLVGHNDVLRSWDRVVRRAGLPIRFTEGYNPKPALSSPLSLALGVIGSAEVLEFALTHDLPESTIREALNSALGPVPGLDLVDLALPPTRTKTEVVGVGYRLTLPAKYLESRSALETRIAEILAAEQLPCTRQRPKKPPRTVDLRPWLVAVELVGDELRFELRVTGGSTAKPAELLELLGLAEALEQGALVERHAVHLADERALEAEAVP